MPADLFQSLASPPAEWGRTDHTPMLIAARCSEATRSTCRWTLRCLGAPQCRRSMSAQPHALSEGPQVIVADVRGGASTRSDVTRSWPAADRCDGKGSARACKAPQGAYFSRRAEAGTSPRNRGRRCHLGPSALRGSPRLGPNTRRPVSDPSSGSDSGRIRIDHPTVRSAEVGLLRQISTTEPYRCCAAWAEVPRMSPIRCQEMLLALAAVTASTI